MGLFNNYTPPKDLYFRTFVKNVLAPKQHSTNLLYESPNPVHNLRINLVMC